MKQIYFLFFLVIIVNSCLNSNKKNSEDKLIKELDQGEKNAIEYKKRINNGITNYNTWNYNKLIEEASFITSSAADSTFLCVALKYINKAIFIDNNKLEAFNIKFQILCELGEYKNAIVVLRKIISLRKYNEQTFLIQGLLYEKMGINDSAQLMYQKSFDAVNKELKLSPTINDQIYRAIIMNFIYGNEAAKKEIEDIIIKNPQNIYAKRIQERVINNFDRKKFIEENIPTIGVTKLE
jgi:tetratricopeptide (TPR) repeat protein